MISDPRLNRTVPLGDILRDCFPSVKCDGFDAAFPSDRIQNIHTKLQEIVKPRSAPITDRRRKEKIISEAWLAVDVDETLCPGYVFNTISEFPSIASEGTERKVCGTVFISKLDQHLIRKGCSEVSLGDLSVVFKRGRAHNDPWNDCASAAMEADDDDDDSCNDCLGQFMSYAERFFYFQHRTRLFMLFVNGGEFRVIRWDRSGCIVTEPLNYVESPEYTKKLLQFLYVYSKATPEERGFDPTATRLSKDSCGWQWMQQIAAAHPKDLPQADGTVLESVPDGFVIKPSRDAPDSPLFASNVLAEDPTVTAGFGDLSCVDTSSRVAPVFKYVRDFFRESIPETWISYRLKVCGRDYLVGKPIFAPHDMVGRGTRGYVALEWQTQRFVFLKDVWRYRGLDQSEGATLKILNDNHVPFVPTLVCHEDVDGGRQETEASEYSATGSKTPDVFDEQEKKSRPIAPMPSRPRVSRARSAIPGGPAQTASTSDGQSPIDATGSGRSAHESGTGGSGKRTRTQTTPPVEVDDGTGLRHLTHYRIVVAQVCLPSSAFTNGMQLVRIVWNCIDGHGDAAKRCSILHRDISVGNILIYPIVKKANRATGQRILVLCGGLLSDWELAKKIPRVDEKPVARQPHLTGTWSYMSVNSVNYPGSPVSIPDELESFFHVLLYLAVRYLYSSLSEGSPRYFIEDYFNSSRTDGEDSTLCSYTKEEVVRKGHLPLVGWKPITFFGHLEPSSPMTNPSASLSPLNSLIAELLRHFKAHYAVMRYDAAIKARERQPKRFKPLPVYNSDAMAKTSTPAPPIASELYDIELLMELWKKHYGDDETPVMARKVVERRPSADRTESTQRLQEPSAEEKKLAAALATHEHVNNLFFTVLTQPAVYIWPSQDRVGDQLKKRRVESSTVATEEEEEEEEEDSDGTWYY